MQYQFTVDGMTCGHCERAVVHAVRQVDTDAIVKVDLETKQVNVSSDKAARDAIANAIQEEGYKVLA
ncbi:heavy-metal-associated domain-containing protein [Comamonas faecalis]|uniref:Heavy-metal-associated domain-containing protein n=1 Tax=Comamonas faecalis TaxID=1387849 RepID=A0ABP7QMP5_9BURK